MKSFLVTSKGVTKGLPFRLDPFPHVPVGEDGRGRHLTRVALGRRDFPSRIVSLFTFRSYAGDRGEREEIKLTVLDTVGDPPVAPTEVINTLENRALWSEYTKQEGYWRAALPSSVDDLRPIRTRERGTLLLVDGSGDHDRRALVLLAIPAGYRGGTRIRVYSKAPVPCPFRGTRDWYGPHPRCTLCGLEPQSVQLEPGWEVTLHPDSGFTNWVTLSEDYDADGIKVLAEGECAQGTAGRMGGHREVLVIMEPGSMIRVSRMGRLYGAPAVHLVRWDGEELLAGEPDVVCQPGDEDIDGAEAL